MRRDCEHYEELGALAAIGELSAAESAELEQHLTNCDKCRRMCADFQRISSFDFGLIAAGKIANGAGDGEFALDEGALLARVRERAGQELAASRQEKPAPKPAASQLGAIFGSRFGGVFGAGAGWRRWAGAAAGYAQIALLAGIVTGVAVYRTERLRLSEQSATLQTQADARQTESQRTLQEQKDSATRLLAASEADRGAVESALKDAQGKYQTIETERANLEAQLSASESRAAGLANELRSADNEKQQAQTTVAGLQSDLQQVRKRQAQQEIIIAGLKEDLNHNTRMSAADDPSLKPGEAEASKLFGARDLHIVDVYDVEGSGKTRRTYGRVFYVANKLLVFYAFDLQDKRKDRVPAGYQAWGYSETDMDKPQNLGLFYLDDASIGRWALKVDDPALMQHLDSVFVTLEPPHGSPFPRGRRLLYANLIGPPNHP